MAEETKICNKCLRILPKESFRLVMGQFHNPYYLGQCKECEVVYQRKHKEENEKVKFSDNLEILIQREYKEIIPQLILDISELNIEPIKLDEIFVRLIEYKDVWFSNYGRMIQNKAGNYMVVKGSYDKYDKLKYGVKKNVCVNGKWKYVKKSIYADKMVVDLFVVNPNRLTNIYIWHDGYNKKDNYYKNLYPLNKEQYFTVKREYGKQGSVSEDYIIKVMNDIQFKPDNWAKKSQLPIMCGVGYRGSEDVEVTSKSYLKWHDMMNRCYSDSVAERQPQYRDCTVCKEWHNYQNFKAWYEEHKYSDKVMDLDKDILYKGSKVYSPETCCLVPQKVNTLFLTGLKHRGKLPIGVYYDIEKKKYCAYISIDGERKKLGYFDSREDAFEKYKEFKEDYIETVAESYKGDIPDYVYEAMLKWKVEITD